MEFHVLYLQKMFEKIVMLLITSVKCNISLVKIKTMIWFIIIPLHCSLVSYVLYKIFKRKKFLLIFRRPPILSPSLTYYEIPLLMQWIMYTIKLLVSDIEILMQINKDRRRNAFKKLCIIHIGIQFLSDLSNCILNTNVIIKLFLVSL